jgi:hypothetical protein
VIVVLGFLSLSRRADMKCTLVTTSLPIRLATTFMVSRHIGPTRKGYLVQSLALPWKSSKWPTDRRYGL